MKTYSKSHIKNEIANKIKDALENSNSYIKPVLFDIGWLPASDKDPDSQYYPRVEGKQAGIL